MDSVTFMREKTCWVNEDVVCIIRFNEARDTGIDAGCLTARKVNSILSERLIIHNLIGIESDESLPEGTLAMHLQ